MTVDPEAPQLAAEPRGLLGFLGTIPGILAAVAAVITASTGWYIAQSSSGETTQDIPQAAAPVPQPTAPVDVGAVQSQLPDVQVGGTDDDLVSACSAGDVDACVDLLDQLTVECMDGIGISCDALYLLTPEGSVYEEYGATCGGRFGWEFAGVCSEL